MPNTPRERRHARTKKSILSAAMEIIAESGPDNLSIREIARRIDYSPAGLYEYFGNKDEIIEAVCTRSNEILYEMLTSVPADQPFVDFMVGLGEAYLKFAHQYTANFRLQFDYTSGVAPTAEQMVTAEDVQNELVFGWLVKQVQKAVDAGHVEIPEGLNTLELVYSYWAMVHGMAILQISNLQYVDYDFARVNGTILKTFIQGFVG